MKMRATGNPVYIPLLNGKSIYVGSEYREIPQEFRREALKLGEVLEIEGISNSELKIPEAPQIDTEYHLVNVIRSMKESEKEGYFTLSGAPNLNVLRDKAQYNVSREEMVLAWERYKKEEESKAV